jgi:hypothetical protein
MRNIRSIASLIIVFTFLVNLTPSFGTEPIEPKPLASGEYIHIVCDRSIYIVNEEIHFSTRYELNAKEIDFPLSTVVYIELLKWNGSKIAQTKAPLIQSSASGDISIPKDIESGIYYLRAYTKWMRNFSPYNYAYLPLKIVNPYSKKTEVGPKGVQSIKKAANKMPTGKGDAFSISGLKTSYERREKVEIDVSALDEVFSGNYNLSIANSTCLDASSISYSFEGEDNSFKPGNIEYYPETRGLSISGTAVNTKSGEAQYGLKINLSSAEYPLFFASTKTDAEGKFLFTFPYLEGKYEFHLSDERNSDEDFDLLIDSDYCNLPLTLPYIPFQLNEDERSVIENVVRNMELSQKFISEDNQYENSQLITLPFYGKPTRTIFEKDFIELDDLEEFIFELVYEVNVRRTDGIAKIFVTGVSTLSSYPVLVLMDNIPISNIEDLLKVSCRRIDRIEVVNAGYVIGDYMYSGIVSIYSEGKDMAGLKLGGNSNFFAMKLFDSNGYTFPGYSENGQKNRKADRRNTLYWEADFPLSKEAPKKVSFYTSDARGEYSILLNGIDSKGNRLVFESEPFVVD